MNRIKREPVITAGVLVAIISASIAMLVSLGYLNLSAEQIRYVMAFVAIAAPVLVAVAGRYYVTPLVEPKDRDGTPLVRSQ